MDPVECGSSKITVSCNSGESEVKTENLSTSDDATVTLNLPEGAQIVTASGTVVYTQPGGPDKSHIKMNPASA